MRLSDILAMLGWLSTFALAWLVILTLVSPTPTIWGAWVFFLLVGFFSSIPTSRK